MALIIEDMKRFRNIFIRLAAILSIAVSCQKTEPVSVQAIPDELAAAWHLLEISAEGNIISEGLDCYFQINTDGTFELYQKSGTQSVRYDLFTGTCTYTDGVLSGVYGNGHPWGGKYHATLSGNTLILSSYNLLETQKYEKKAIPEDVRKNANMITRSGTEFSKPIL